MYSRFVTSVSGVFVSKKGVIFNADDVDVNEIVEQLRSQKRELRGEEREVITSVLLTFDTPHLHERIRMCFQ